jgi:tetratricopeptide (TPR) repeat protein
LEIKNKARLRNPKQKTGADNSLILLMSTLAMILAAYPATRHVSNDLGLRGAISLAGAKQGVDDQSITQRGETIYSYANRLAQDRDYLSISVDNLFQNGPGEIAKKICEEVLLKNSRNINALSCLSIFYENTGDLQKALEFRVKMLEIDPLNYLNMYRIGKLYSLIGDKSQSILYLEKSLQIDSDDPVQLETKILLSDIKSNQ